MREETKKHKSGFTLLELLVVVLIIGILAAIALPQYRFAVGKSEYATLKNITKSIRESVERYVLVNNSYPIKFADLDIDLKVKLTKETDNYSQISFTGDTEYDYCQLWHTSSNKNVLCTKKITGKKMRYEEYPFSPSNKCCTVLDSLNVNDIPNRICQAETGKSTPYFGYSNRNAYYY